MNFRPSIAIMTIFSALSAMVVVGPAGAQSINGISASTFTLNANSGGYDGQDATAHGVPAITGSSLQLTTDKGFYDTSFPTFFGSENTSAFYNTPVNVTDFTASFDYVFNSSNPAGSFGAGNGFTFIIQNDTRGLTALGTSGFGDGPSGDPNTISPSVALEVNLFTGFGQATGTAVAVDGDVDPFANPNFFTSPGNVNILDGNEINFGLSYNGTDLTETLTDLTTLDTFQKSYNVDIANAVGGPDAIVGFTGGTGAAVGNQYISDFSYSSGTAPAPESSTLVGFGLLMALSGSGLALKAFRTRAR